MSSQKIDQEQENESVEADPNISSEEQTQTNELHIATPVAMSMREQNRVVAEYPFSPEIIASLTARGVSVFTRSQSLFLERTLAGQSVFTPLCFGKSRFLPLCLSILERVEPVRESISAIILCAEASQIHYISHDLVDIGQFHGLTVLPIRQADDLEQQCTLLKQQVDIVVGDVERILSLIEQQVIDLSKVQIVGVCELLQITKKLQSESSKKIWQSLQHAPQIMGFYRSLPQQSWIELQQLFPHVQSLSLLPEEKSTPVYITDKRDEALKGLLSMMTRTCAIHCRSEEEANGLAKQLIALGITAACLFGRHERREKDVLNKKIQSHCFQAVLLHNTWVERSVVQNHIYLYVPQELEKLQKGSMNLSLLLAAEEELEELQHVSFTQQSVPSMTTVQQSQQQQLLGLLRRNVSEQSTIAMRDILHAIHQQADGAELLSAALQGFFQWSRIQQNEMSKELFRLESKEKSSPKRGNYHNSRRGRFRSRRNR